jgi:hypothetical protein
MKTMKKNILIFIVLTAILFSITGYAQTVTIGSQVWTSTNLNVSTYRNGEVIPQVNDGEVWAKLTTGAWCYYDNDSSNGTKYGKLYNWYALNDPRGLAPKGYHIPTNAEWTALTDYLGGEAVAGIKMKSTSGWDSYLSGGSKTCPDCESWNAEYRTKVPCHTCKDTRSVSAPTETYSGDGLNSSGFSGLPGGYRNFLGPFKNIGNYGCWWSSSDYNSMPNFVFSRYMNSNEIIASQGAMHKRAGIAVRCLKD